MIGQTVVVADAKTREVIAVVPENGKSIIKDGYLVYTTCTGDDVPIFKDRDGKVFLNCFNVHIDKE